jgi:hypothetical protein
MGTLDELDMCFLIISVMKMFDCLAKSVLALITSVKMMSVALISV